MTSGPWHWLKTVPGLLAAPRPSPWRQAELIVSMQRRIVLPVRAGLLAVVVYFVFSAGWSNGPPSTEMVLLQTLQGFFLFYIVCNVIAGAIFFSWRRFPPGLFQWLAFVLGLLDGLFVCALMLITGGWQSIAFWLFPVLIVLNAVGIPLAVPQIALNLLLAAFFAGVAILSPNIGENEINLMYVPGPPHASAGTTNTAATQAHPPPLQSNTGENENQPSRIVPRSSPSRFPSGTNTVAAQSHPVSPEKPLPPPRWDSSLHQPEEETPAESFILRMFVLLLLTLCCYGVQALAERQRRELEEAREFAVREAQLHSAGRLAAEFAHQIKNPLAIITNAAYSLRRSLRENKNSSAQQIEIIQEEVARADRVVTQIMGYAQLSEGRVEKLDVIAELESAIAQAFPAAVPTEIRIHRQYADYFPPLLMQRGHLSETFLNLLKNAGEAIGRAGNIFIKADCLGDNSVEISIRDDGSGIPPDKIIRIFEAYYTTKTGGSGLGLAIVRHNAELYGGNVRVKSEVGKGAEFILTFPAKAIVNIRK